MSLRLIRSAVPLLLLTGVALSAACGDEVNTNKGVNGALMGQDGGSCTRFNMATGQMEMDPACMDGGMDGGDACMMPDGTMNPSCHDGGMDAGDGCMMPNGTMNPSCMDGGTDGGACMRADGGMDMTCVCRQPDGGLDMACMGVPPMVRRVWVLQTASGAEGLIGIDPKTNNEFPMPFVMMNSFGGIAGIPEGAVMSHDQMLAYVAYSNPAKLVVIEMARRDVKLEVSLGTGSQKTGDVTHARADALLVSGATTNSLHLISTGSNTVLQTVNGAQLTGLVEPSTIRMNTSGTTAVVASSNASHNQIVFVEVDGSGLRPRNDRTLTLQEGTTFGTGPTLCQWMRTRDEGYCTVSGGADSSGVAPPSLWHFTLGGTARRVLTLAAGVRDVVTSPDEQRLFVTTGSGVNAYYIAGDARLAPLFIQSVATGAGANRLAVDAEGKNLLVTNSTAGTVTRLRLTDLVLQSTYVGYATPETIYTVP